MSFHGDGYESALVGHRGLAARFTTPIDDLSLYDAGGLAARIVDMVADTAVAKGAQVLAGADPVPGVSDEFDRLGVMPALADALRWARLTGGGAIVLITNDGASLREPLVPAALERIEELKVFDRHAVTATEQRYTDPGRPNFGQPEVYQVRSVAPTGTAQFYVHETRLVPIPGDPRPSGLSASPIPWEGRPAVVQAYRTLRRYLRALNWAEKLLERKQQGIYSMKGLAEAIEAGLETAVQKRVSLVDSVRGVLNTVAIDSEDSYTLSSMDMGGVKDILDKLEIALSADTGIPVTLLFGRSPGGMNATGDADLEGFHNLVRGAQRRKLNAALERLVSLIMAQRTFKSPPESWTIQWNPLLTATPKEDAELRKANADADKVEQDALSAAMDNGLSEDEARQYMEERGMYGLKAGTDGGRDAATRYAAQTA